MGTPDYHQVDLTYAVSQFYTGELESYLNRDLKYILFNRLTDQQLIEIDSGANQLWQANL
jgi:hypothetical protein